MAEAIIRNRNTITEFPSDMQIRCEYSDGDCIYAGYAVRGSTTSEEIWFIMKMEYDVSGNMTLKQTAEKVSWDARDSVTYA